jgi:hypothetical protein
VSAGTRTPAKRVVGGFMIGGFLGSGEGEFLAHRAGFVQRCGVCS